MCDDYKEEYSGSILGFNVLKETTTKEFLAKLEQRFVKNKKTKIDILLTSLISIRCKRKDKRKKKKKNKKVAYTTPQKKQQKKSDDPKAVNYFFYGAESYGLVCSEINLTSVLRHMWWIDSSATTHISMSMQDCLNCRKPGDGERYIYVGNARLLKLEQMKNSDYY